VVPSNTVSDRGPGPPWEGEISGSDWGLEHPVKTVLQIAAKPLQGVKLFNSLQELSNALSNGTIDDPTQLPLPLNELRRNAQLTP